MSIVIETFLICDGHCGTNYGVDNRHQSGQAHRANAKQEGWIVKNGKDYCPDCTRKLSKKNKSNTPGGEALTNYAGEGEVGNGLH